MKKIVALLFVVLAGAACTPEELRLYNTVNGTDHPLPPTITDRESALELPVTLVTADDCGTTRNVVAWYGEDGRSFVYEDEAGARWIYLADSFGCGFHLAVSDDGCVYDTFRGVVNVECPDDGF